MKMEDQDQDMQVCVSRRKRQTDAPRQVQYAVHRAPASGKINERRLRIVALESSLFFREEPIDDINGGAPVWEGTGLVGISMI